MTVVPVIAAVTVVVRIFAPPALFGTFSKNDPCTISMSRVPDLNLNTELAPIRVTVLSEKESSALESRPVSKVEDPVNDWPSFAG